MISSGELSLPPPAANIIFRSGSHDRWMGPVAIQVHFYFSFTEPGTFITWIRDYADVGSQITPLPFYQRQDHKILSQGSPWFPAPEGMKIQGIIRLLLQLQKIHIIP